MMSEKAVVGTIIPTVEEGSDTTRPTDSISFQMTSTPQMPTNIPLDAYASRLEYAKIQASEILSLLPYANTTPVYDEYSGCVETNDFQGLFTYTIYVPEAPMDIVSNSFTKSFQDEGWGFDEAGTELIGEYNVPQVTYNLYRLSSKHAPALETLMVIFVDPSAVLKSNHIEVRAEYTHIETKENFAYIMDFQRFSHDLGLCQSSWWY